jgi:hypothetical protein
MVGGAREPGDRTDERAVPVGLGGRLEGPARNRTKVPASTRRRLPYPNGTLVPRNVRNGPTGHQAAYVTLASRNYREGG